MLREIDRDPPPGATKRERAQARAQRVKLAEHMRARWGCPAAGHKPPAALPRDLADEAEHVARTVGIERGETCPFACIERPDPWVLEVLDAVRLTSDLHVPIDETLGRDPSAVDLAAMGELLRAQSAALESDRRILEQERERDAPPKAPR